METRYRDDEGNVLYIRSNSEIENPRHREDNLSTIICTESKLQLGDPHSIRRGYYYDLRDLKRKLKKTYDIAVIMPVYARELRGLYMTTLPLSNIERYDGQVGYAYIKKQDLMDARDVERLDDSDFEWAVNELLYEVDEYSEYLAGKTFYHEIVNRSGKVINGADEFETINEAQNDIYNRFPGMKKWFEIN